MGSPTLATVETPSGFSLHPHTLRRKQSDRFMQSADNNTQNWRWHKCLLPKLCEGATQSGCYTIICCKYQLEKNIWTFMIWNHTVFDFKRWQTLKRMMVRPKTSSLQLWKYGWTCSWTHYNRLLSIEPDPCLLKVSAYCVKIMPPAALLLLW